MASYMDNEAIVDETFDDEARDRPLANKQKEREKERFLPNLQNLFKTATTKPP